MTYDQFKKTLEKLLKVKNVVAKINDELKVIDHDFNFLSLGVMEDLLVDTIEIAIEDESHWLYYWLYDRNAKFSKKKIVILADGKKIAIDNYRSLYDLIKSKK